MYLYTINARLPKTYSRKMLFNR